MIPKKTKRACKTLYYKLDKNEEPNVKEVVIEASTKKELSKKLGHIQRVSPDKIVLNGTLREADTVFQTFLEGKL